ncbi:MAG: cytochrome C oxidase subunit IV family protein [Deltaproteobacteria bacterium]|nr:cytochrome C oxidase subunit IV family protein [Deltaproteobacteria bacterium]
MSNKHIMSYKNLGITLTALLILTGTTVFISTFDYGALNIWIALIIASCKASLVLLFFMHMKHEPGLIKWSFLITVSFLAIFIGFLFLDISFR